MGLYRKFLRMLAFERLEIGLDAGHVALDIVGGGEGVYALDIFTLIIQTIEQNGYAGFLAGVPAEGGSIEYYFISKRSGDRFRRK